MSSRRIGVLLTLMLVVAQVSAAQIVVNSIFQLRNNADYGDANNWSPPEVPNNSPKKSYDVTIRTPYFVRMNVDATISNLDLNGTYTAEDHSLTVIGSATLNDSHIFASSSLPAGVVFSAGSLSSFSGGSLRGSYYFSNYNTTAGWATLQFGGADVTTLSQASLALVGPRTRVVDEFGSDGLRHLAHVESGSTLQLNGHQTIVSGPFTNDGLLVLSSGFDQPGLFTISGELTNFDAKTGTLTGGEYYLGGNYIAGSNYPAVLQFAGAHIVHNASAIAFGDALARIVDENGSDALRNFSDNALGGVFNMFERDFSTSGDFTNNGKLIVGAGTFTVNGSLTNFDPATHTLTGGTYELYGPVYLVFDGADIVNNAASIRLSAGARISDQNGNDALRNFAHNLRGGEFTISDSQVLTAAGDFTNAGAVTILGPFGGISGQFKLTEGHRYLQTEGTTYLVYGHFTGDMVIDGGSLTTTPLNAFFSPPSQIDGDLSIGDALFGPRALTVNGAVHLSPSSRFLTTPDDNDYGGSPFAVTETFTADGTLQIQAPKSPPPSSETYLVVQADGGIIGTFSNAPNGARVPTTDGLGSFVVSYTPSNIFLSGFLAIPFTTRLLNISTRVEVQTGENVLIGGFIITGTQPKRIILRALGPSLSSFILGALADPVLELYDSAGGLIASNDNWRSNQEAEIIATGIPPSNDLESAIVMTLPANNSAYTAVVRGVNNGAGIGVVEAYDLDQTVDSRSANISTRGLVQTGDNVLIAGLITLGQNPLRIIVRAMGPSLPVAGALQDPTLSLYDGNGGLVASNDNWRSDQEAEIIATGIPPSNDLESAIVATLPTIGGSYTAIVQGKNGTSGSALVEVYDLNR